MYTIYGTAKCPYCDYAKDLLTSKDRDYRYVNVMEDEDAQALFKEKGWRKVPQIFEEDEHIGGFTDLQAHLS